MKLKYEKPMVAVDRYELTQAIAGCSIKVNSIDRLCFTLDEDVPDKLKSFAMVEGWFVDGTSGLSACTVWIKAGDGHDGYCYHTQANGALTS